MQILTFETRLLEIKEYSKIFEQGKAYTRKEIEYLIKEYCAAHEDIMGPYFTVHQLNTIFKKDHCEISNNIKRNFYILKTEEDLRNDFNNDINKKILALIPQKISVKE